MENTKFKIGDIVELKSGSPKMTVSNVSEDLVSLFKTSGPEPEDIEVAVEWVDVQGIAQRKTFSEPMLKFYDEDK